MDGNFNKSGGLTGAVSSTRTLWAKLHSPEVLKATMSPAATLQANIVVSKNLQATITSQKRLKGNMHIPQAVKSGEKPKISEVTLLAGAWVTEEDRRHSQTVEVNGVTNKSQVDLTPDVQQLEVFYEKDVTFVTENFNYVVTVYAIGQKPVNDYIVQATLTEVDVPDGTPIWGITVGTPINPDRLGKVTVDDTLSDTSTNPIQNKVVAEEFDKRINIAKNTDIDKLFR
jgi:hypothetical protein